MEIRHQLEEGFCVGVHGCLLTVVWGREVVLDDLHQLAAIQRDVIARYGHCVVVTIIRAWLVLGIPEDVRRAAADNLTEFDSLTLGTAMVVEAGGARAAFFRSIMTAVNLVARSRMPQRVFTTIDDGIRWVLGHDNVDPRTRAEAEAIVAGAYAIAERYGHRQDRDRE